MYLQNHAILPKQKHSESENEICSKGYYIHNVHTRTSNQLKNLDLTSQISELSYSSRMQETETIGQKLFISGSDRLQS